MNEKMQVVTVNEFEQAYFSKFGYIASKSKNFQLIEKPEYTLAHVGINYYNSVFKCNFEQQTEEKISDIVNFFASKRAKFEFWITPSTKPINLSLILEKHNFELDSVYPCYYINAKQCSILSYNSDLKVEIAHDQNDHKLYSDLIIRRHPSYKILQDYYNDIYKNKGQYINFIGSYKDEPVATISLYFHGDIAIICELFTLPEYRGKGFAKTMNKAVIDYAKNIGFNKIINLATIDGNKVYQKLGFKKICEFASYTMSMK